MIGYWNFGNHDDIMNLMDGIENKKSTSDEFVSLNDFEGTGESDRPHVD